MTNHPNRSRHMRTQQYQDQRSRLFQAIKSLAGVGSIQMRLAGAASHLYNVGGDEFPEELQERFASLKRQLLKQPLDTPLRPLPVNDDEGQKLADEVLSLYHSLTLIELNQLQRGE